MSNEYSREEQNALKTGRYVTLALIALSLFYVSGRKAVEHQESGSYYPVYARFGRTDGLQVGDVVRLAGMPVGKVTAAKLDDKFNAILTLELKDGLKVPDDSSASIVSDGILGSKYIEIEPGGSEDYIPEGGEFSYTQDAMVLEELVERIIGMGKAKQQSAGKGETK